MSNGVLYVCLGVHFIYAIPSIESLRKSGYNGPIRVITDFDFWPDNLNIEIIKVSIEENRNDSFANRYFKTKMYDFTFDGYTLYLDCDTIIERPIDSFWELDEPLAMAIDAGITSDNATLSPDINAEEIREIRNLQLHNSPFFNSGVILFSQNEQNKRLFNTWHKEWLRYKTIDQLALLRALSQENVIPYILESRYNFQVTPRYNIIRNRTPELTDVVVRHSLGQKDYIGAEQRSYAIWRRLPKTKVRIAEVGVFDGMLSNLLLSRPNIELTMVDLWKQRPEWNMHPQSVMDCVRNRAIEQTDFAADRRHIIVGNSWDVPSTMENAYFDSVFIDADHSYEAVKKDIVAWLPKVKTGGWLCGHDYCKKKYPGIVQAVHELNIPFELDEHYTWFCRITGS